MILELRQADVPLNKYLTKSGYYYLGSSNPVKYDIRKELKVPLGKYLEMGRQCGAHSYGDTFYFLTIKDICKFRDLLDPWLVMYNLSH